MRCFFEISQNKLPKRAFRTMLPAICTEQSSKTIVSCEASWKFHRTNKLPKRSFRARLPPIFREQASKTSVSHDASDNFHRKSFQNKRFVRGFFKISQNNLPKRAFRARHPGNFTERTSCQKDRFVRGFLQFSENKLPKRAFRTMLPTIFTEKVSKTNVSRDASDNFSVSPQFRAIDPPNPTRGFIQQKQNVRLATTACHSTFQKCMNQAQEARGNTRHTKITILPQFRTSDQHEVTRGLQNELQNSHFTSPKGSRSNLALLHPKVISESAFTMKSAFDTKSDIGKRFWYQKRF